MFTDCDLPMNLLRKIETDPISKKSLDAQCSAKKIRKATQLIWPPCSNVLKTFRHNQNDD